MAITAVDIYKKEFDSKVRGYDSKQVDSFLDEVLESYTDLEKRIAKLTDENESLRDKMAYYEKMKDSMNDALILSQTTATQNKEKAQEEAQRIIDKAKEDALVQQHELKDETKNLEETYEKLRSQVLQFRTQSISILDYQKKLLENDNWDSFAKKYYSKEEIDNGVVTPNQPSNNEVDNEEVSDVQSNNQSEEAPKEQQPVETQNVIADNSNSGENHNDEDNDKDSDVTIVFPN